MKDFNLHRVFSGTGILVATTLLVTILFLGLVISSFFTKNDSRQVGSIPTPTPNNVLLTEEESYPNATPQPFRRERLQPGEPAQFGTLVVTSDVEDVIVLLDATTHQNLDDPIKGKDWPLNITPFTVARMPVGTHYLLARKDGYVIAEETYEIKADQITRVKVKIIPL